MPTYDYRCTACRHAFELFQSMREPVKRTCPECGRKALERLIGTGAALIFKGSGFYQTDYRSDSYKKAADADKPASDAPKPDAKPASDAKGEAKPASEPAKPAESKVKPPSVSEPRPARRSRKRRSGE